MGFDLILGPGLVLSPLLLAQTVQPITYPPLTLDIVIQEVWGTPSLDLPPGNQRPNLYAVVEVNQQAVTTPTVTVPRINEPIFPDWTVSAVVNRDPLRPEAEIFADIRIFDADTDEDDKVLLMAAYFDPVACQMRIGEQQFPGTWSGDRQVCQVTVPRLESELGYAAFTLSAQAGSP